MADLKEYYKKISPYLVYVIALVGGSVFCYGFAPFNMSIAAILSPALLLWCLNKRSTSQAFLIGLCYGIGMFGMGTNWVYVSIHDYGYTTAWLATLITGLFVLIIALYPALMSYFFNKFFKKSTYTTTLLVFPSLWVIFEMLRGWALSGFPWLFVGYAHITNILRAFAPIGSVWAVSLVSVFISTLIFCIFDYFYNDKEKPKVRNGLVITLIATFVVAFSLNRIVWTVPTTQTLTVSMVQGNIAQLMRWDPAYIASIVQTYERLTQQALTSNVVIWPEGAIPVPLPNSHRFFQEMGTMAKASNVALITGVPTQLPNHVNYYNSLYAVGMTGVNNNCEAGEQEGCIYFKEHLVPFGEYVPFEKLLRGLIAFFNLPMSSFVPGPANQKPLLAHGFKFAPAICYEIAYPIFVQQMSKHADFILTVSNDTWFGKSIGPLQHLQIAQFRALETGKNVIRATNTGYTAIIDPDGRIQVIAPAFEENVTTGSVSVMQGVTLWTRVGIWPLAALLVVMLAGGYFLQTRKKP
ncbi:MAG: apolipoprotein N-acyltransferase [Gammaproteobacteria bacterium 39-13]|nr:apolipoprotein N-acyltransferase [Gammaproteobacteria bacterium]OJV96481.1 MAG: apolipoprotein N-acyltransferase [Gammaproteobacteria bacterium 39-13]